LPEEALLPLDPILDPLEDPLELDELDSAAPNSAIVVALPGAPPLLPAPGVEPAPLIAPADVAIKNISAIKMMEAMMF
jgi:hypothetical protein